MARASPRSPELPLSLAALLKLSARNASWICDMSACSWSEASPSLSPECVFRARVCACVRVFQRGSSMWEGKKHDTCFVNALTAQHRGGLLCPQLLCHFSLHNPARSRAEIKADFRFCSLGSRHRLAGSCSRLSGSHSSCKAPPPPPPARAAPLPRHPAPTAGRAGGGEVSVWLAPAIRQQETGSSLDSSPSVVALTSHLKEGRKG